MTIINGIIYYTKKETAQLVGKSPQTINLWDKWSNEREEEGLERFIPKPIRWKSDYRLWSAEDVDKIKEFASSVVRGSMVEYSKRQWGKRGKSDESMEQASEDCK